MPWSFGDSEKRKALALLSARAGIRGVLDLGAGAGIWRELSREFVIGSSPWIAVEAYEPYIKRFKLRQRYSRVRIQDLRLIKYGSYPAHVFIFGDVLEHMPKTDALKVMRRAASMGSVVVMMPFLPTLSEEQDAVEGVEWERHRHVWCWQEWLDALAALGLETEVVTQPPGDARNKGVTIRWHRSHAPLSYWQGREHFAYYQVVREYLEALSPGASILDVGSWDTPVATWGRFERRYTCDLAIDPKLPGVTSFVGDFLEWELPERMSVATCLQTVEHLRDQVVEKFGRKLRASADALIVSVPFGWPKGQEACHQQDPIDLEKLAGFIWRSAQPAPHRAARQAAEGGGAVELKLTIVTSSHNYGRYLKEWAQSIIALTRKPAACVIVDNGSNRWLHSTGRAGCGAAQRCRHLLHLPGDSEERLRHRAERRSRALPDRVGDAPGCR